MAGILTLRRLFSWSRLFTIMRLESKLFFFSLRYICLHAMKHYCIFMSMNHESYFFVGGFCFGCLGSVEIFNFKRTGYRILFGFICLENFISSFISCKLRNAFFSLDLLSWLRSKNLEFIWAGDCFVLVEIGLMMNFFDIFYAKFSLYCSPR